MRIHAFRAFATLLQRPDCVLEDLNFDGSRNIDDEIVITLANGLTNNRTLKRMTLPMYDNSSKITSIGWGALQRLVCNESSIEDTYQSNHTLETVKRHKLKTDLSPLYSYLDLNKNNEPKEAARKKIIKVHFSSKGIDMQQFVDMDAGVLPYTLAWMGRDSVEVFALMYDFVRNMPLFYDFGGGFIKSDGVQKKQKVG